MYKLMISRRCLPRIALLSLLLVLPSPSLGADPPPETPKGEKQTEAAIDLFQKHKDEYVATAEPALIEIGSATYLAVTGQGEPGGESFRKKTSALYGMAYTIMMKHKFAGKDYVVGPLEGLWWGTKGKHDLLEVPKDKWNWKLLIRTPGFVTQEEVAAIADQMSPQGKEADGKEIRLETLKEGRCVQVLHVGPYDKEHETIAKMLAFAKEQGLAPAGPHHEIYLSDPNRVPPEKLRTILRQPVK